MTYSSRYIASGWELVVRKAKCIIRVLELSAAQNPRRGVGLDIEFTYMVSYLINHAYVMTPHVKCLDIEAHGSFLVGEYVNILKG